MYAGLSRVSTEKANLYRAGRCNPSMWKAEAGSLRPASPHSRLQPSQGHGKIPVQTESSVHFLAKAPNCSWDSMIPQLVLSSKKKRRWEAPAEPRACPAARMTAPSWSLSICFLQTGLRTDSVHHQRTSPVPEGCLPTGSGWSLSCLAPG